MTLTRRFGRVFQQLDGLILVMCTAVFNSRRYIDLGYCAR